MLPGIVGVIQANEALKILVGYGEPLTGRLLMFDAMATSFRTLKLRRDPECATCGAHAEAWQAWESGRARGAPKEAVAVRMDSLPAATPATPAAPEPVAAAAEPVSANGASANGSATNGSATESSATESSATNGAKASSGKAKSGKGKAKAKAGKAG